MTTWLDSVSTASPVEELSLVKAASLAAFVSSHGFDYGVRFIEARKTATNAEIVVIELDIDRPQDKRFDIRRCEVIDVLVEGSEEGRVGEEGVSTVRFRW